MKRWIPALLLIASAQQAIGQSGADIRPRVLGAIFDTAAKGARIIYGSPGAALIGSRVEIGTDLTQALISARRNYLIGQSSDDGLLRVVSLATGQFVAAPQIAADVMAFSPDEGSAVVYSAATHTVTILSGLPDAPRIVRAPIVAELDTVTALSVSDGGVAAVLAGADGTIFLSDASGVRAVAAVGRASAVRFIDTSRVLIADEQGGLVQRMSIAGDIRLETIATLDRVFDAAVTDDGAHLLLLARDARALYVSDLSSGQIATIACDCTPTGFSRLPGQSRFLLTGVKYGAAWAIDLSVSEPALFALPSAQPVEEKE